MVREAKILFLDDDAEILSGIKRQLHRKFQVHTSDNPAEALRLLQTEGPFAVVVSDLKMPGMDGITFLGKIKQEMPDTVRVLLTGHGGLEATLEAINKGHVFRFLNKPCSPEEMEETLKASVTQYRLITAEKDLLEKTLQSAIQVLVELIGLNNPMAHQRGVRATETMVLLAKRINNVPVWQWQAAGMLSQMGWVTLAPDILERWIQGKQLNDMEAKVVQEYPKAGARLIATIPRLEEVAEIVAHQDERYSESGDRIPLGARALKLALDLDLLLTMQKYSPFGAVVALKQREGLYDPNLLNILELVATGERKGHIEALELGELSAVMILTEDLYAKNGLLLLRRDTMLSLAQLERLNLFHRTVGVKEPVSVWIPDR